MGSTLNMNAAWANAVHLVLTNRTVLAVIAGVFFLLPNMAFSLLGADANASMVAATAANTSPDQAYAVLGEYYRQNAWIYILISILQYVGILAMLALLTDINRPTVGEAIKFGFIALFPALAAQLLLAFGVVICVAIPVGIIAATDLPVLIGVAIIIALAAAIFLYIRFSMTIPAIAIDKVLNPIKALTISWEITKGNSWRLLGFFALLSVCMILISIIVALIFGFIFGIFGSIGEIISSLAMTIIGALWMTVLAGVWVSVYNQLSGSRAAVAAEFE